MRNMPVNYLLKILRKVRIKRNKNKVNFFWMGDEFYFIQNIVVKSYLKVGHEPILWLYGKKPSTRFWKEIEDQITIKDADSLEFDMHNFLESGGHPTTAGDIFKFYFMYNYGGLYSDLDAFALKKFPDDNWILCSGETNRERLSIGVIKAPPKQKVFLECLSKVKTEWGNVKLFNDEYLKIFGNITSTHENELFYPYVWDDCYNLFKKMDIPKNSYSIHFYGFGLKRHLKEESKKNSYRLLYPNLPKDLSDLNEKWCEKNTETLLGQLWKWLQE